MRAAARAHETLTAAAIPATTAGIDPARRPGLERVLGTNDLMSIAFLEAGVQVARSVCRVLIKQARRLVGYGTGFLVSPRLLLTNNHVLGSREEASTSEAEFNFQADGSGRALSSMVFRLTPEDFFATNPHLDYTLVAVAARAPDGTALRDFGWNRLVEETGKILLGEFTNIIQHPNGEPKQLALRENQLIDVLDDFLHYHTDTAPGSSGSPVFNDQWEVVALHHSGVPRTDDQGRYLTPDGSLWTPSMGEQRIAWIANEGARISRVVADVKERALSAAERRLLMAAFNEVAPAGRSASPRPDNIQSNGSPAESPLRQPDGSAVWTVPIHVTIQVGQAEPASSASRAAPAEGFTVSLPPHVRPAPRPDGGADELRAALSELEAARARPYYDHDADAAQRADYYAGVDEELTPAERFHALSELVTRTHVTRLSYKPARHVYPWVDLQPNLMLRSVYSGMEFDPGKLIQEDFRIEAERAARLRERLNREAAPTQTFITNELDLLEAQLPYNCEHVVPQSWFEKQEPMRGDQHHLFACESGCNSFRGNIPYADFADFDEAIREQCGKREGMNRPGFLGGSIAGVGGANGETKQVFGRGAGACRATGAGPGRST